MNREGKFVARGARIMRYILAGDGSSLRAPACKVSFFPGERRSLRGEDSRFFCFSARRCMCGIRPVISLVPLFFFYLRGAASRV